MAHKFREIMVIAFVHISKEKYIFILAAKLENKIYCTVKLPMFPLYSSLK